MLTYHLYPLFERGQNLFKPNFLRRIVNEKKDVKVYRYMVDCGKEDKNEIGFGLLDNHCDYF